MEQPKCTEFATELHAWLLATSLCILGTACSHMGVLDELKVDECQMGGNCSVKGRLVADSPWDFHLLYSNGCIALAVPESSEDAFKRANGEDVRVTGTGFTQPTPDPGAAFYHYEVDGARVNANYCAFALKVRTVTSAEGVLLWAAN